MTREERRAYWRDRIESQAASGESVADYCRGNNIRADLFYSWRRRFRNQEPLAKGFVELIPGKLAAAGTSIRIHLGVRFCIEVERGFDPETLIAVVAALSDSPRCSV